jgi:nucleoside-diphosphate-sugar epimerase
MDFLVSDRALQQVASAVPPGARVVITGATGWLGRTLVILLAQSQVDLYLIGSHKRKFEFGETVMQVNEFNLERIREFEPTAVFDFAFVTREHLSDMGIDRYVDINNSLIRYALEIFDLPSITHGLFTSSGAAVHPHFDENLGIEANPYGYLKRQTEKLVDQASKTHKKRSLVIRPWSLSGALTTKLDAFAFSSFIHQSSTGIIEVRSKLPVMRRYVSADDFLAVSISLLYSENSLDSPFDSGGELISAVDLAELIAGSCEAPVEVIANVNPDLGADCYFSDNSSWQFYCKQLDYIPETIAQQIARNLSSLRQKSRHL